MLSTICCFISSVLLNVVEHEAIVIYEEQYLPSKMLQHSVPMLWNQLRAGSPLCCRQVSSLCRNVIFYQLLTIRNCDFSRINNQLLYISYKLSMNRNT